MESLKSVLNNCVFVRYSYRTKRGPLSGIKQIESILGDAIKFKKSKYPTKLNKCDYFKIEHTYK